jgi:hypothetical protein
MIGQIALKKNTREKGREQNAEKYLKILEL